MLMSTHVEKFKCCHCFFVCRAQFSQKNIKHNKFINLASSLHMLTIMQKNQYQWKATKNKVCLPKKVSQIPLISDSYMSRELPR